MVSRELESLRETLKKTFHWTGHSTFYFQPDTGERIVFIDPFNFKQDFLPKKADFVFITHAHNDHWSLKDLQNVVKPETKIFAVQGCEGFPSENFARENLEIVSPGAYKNFDGLKVRAIPAYNTHPERLSYHPRENNWVGYIFTINEQTFYHAGDTDFTDEMKQLKDLDVAFLPVGGTFTMDVMEAAEASNHIGVKITVPIHYRALLKEHYTAAEEKLKKAIKGDVIIFDEYK